MVGLNRTLGVGYCDCPAPPTSYGDNAVATPKLFVLGRPEDFTNQEVEWLADLITEKLTDDGIEAESFAFQIRVEYVPAQETQ